MRLVVVVALLAGSAVATLGGRAAGEESLSELKARMRSIRAELNAAASRVSDLEARHHELEDRIADIHERRGELTRRSASLQKQAIVRARELYRAGGTGTMELLFSAQDFNELTARAKVLSQISREDTSVFIALARSREELTDLEGELSRRDEELLETVDNLEAESDRLQQRFEDVADEYNELKAKLAEAARREAIAQPSSIPSSAPPVVYRHGDLTCPVAGPTSFIDSWGYPRSGGRSHQGVDMMAAYGTPIVAITSGTITYAGYGDSAGNWLILSGDNGDAYWYMHNQENLVTGGHVGIGQQIATVGDTGNAEGTPHLHFEYHPGGGAAVNPYPLVRPLC